MRKEFRFLLQSARINLALVAGYAAVLTLGAILFPAPEGERNLFYNYFISAPITVSFILFIMSFSMGANNLNISLTLGGRRRDYFWALQPVLALYVGTSWAIQLLMSAVPKALRWTDPWGWDLSLLGGWPLWVYPLVCWTVLAFGTLCGLLMVESRVWRGIVVALAAMVMTAALIFLMVMAAGPKIPLWGDLPYILGGVLAVVLAVSEFFLWRRITRFSVMCGYDDENDPGQLGGSGPGLRSGGGDFPGHPPDHGGGALLGPSRQQRHHLRDRSARGGGADDPGRYRHLSGHHL